MSFLGLTPAEYSSGAQRRIQHLPQAAREIGWRAQVRLCQRYRQLTARGKHPNPVIVAIARELAAFAWAIARTVP